MRQVLFALVGLSVLAAMPASSEAQGDRRHSQVVELDPIVVEGRRQKPSAFYVLNRANAGYEVVDLRTSFVREVVQSTRDDAL